MRKRPRRLLRLNRLLLNQGKARHTLICIRVREVRKPWGNIWGRQLRLRSRRRRGAPAVTRSPRPKQCSRKTVVALYTARNMLLVPSMFRARNMCRVRSTLPGHRRPSSLCVLKCQGRPITSSSKTLAIPARSKVMASRSALKRFPAPRRVRTLQLRGLSLTATHLSPACLPRRCIRQHPHRSSHTVDKAHGPADAPGTQPLSPLQATLARYLRKALLPEAASDPRSWVPGLPVPMRRKLPIRAQRTAESIPLFTRRTTLVEVIPKRWKSAMRRSWISAMTS